MIPTKSTRDDEDRVHFTPREIEMRCHSLQSGGGNALPMTSQLIEFAHLFANHFLQRSVSKRVFMCMVLIASHNSKVLHKLSIKMQAVCLNCSIFCILRKTAIRDLWGPITSHLWSACEGWCVSKRRPQAKQRVQHLSSQHQIIDTLSTRRSYPLKSE